MAVSIIRTAWAGTSGGPGVTQMAITEASGTFLTPTNAQTAVNAVRAFWNAIASYLPNELVLTVSPVIDSYNEVDGKLTGSTTAATAPSSVGGTETGAYAMASGFKINLNTGTIRHGRRVRGGIYVVPAALSVFTVTGSVGSTARTPINTAAETMRTALANAGLPLTVYSRHIPEGKPKGPRAGALALVTGMETNEKGAVLRGRRD